MAEKRLIVERINDVDFKALTYLAASVKNETLYAVYHSDNEPEDPMVLELATSAEELTKIRDLLIDVVNKIENNYGLEHTVEIKEAI